MRGLKFHNKKKVPTHSLKILPEKKLSSMAKKSLRTKQKKLLNQSEVRTLELEKREGSGWFPTFEISDLKCRLYSTWRGGMPRGTVACPTEYLT